MANNGGHREPRPAVADRDLTDVAPGGFLPALDFCFRVEKRKGGTERRLDAPDRAGTGVWGGTPRGVLQALREPDGERPLSLAASFGRPNVAAKIELFSQKHGGLADRDRPRAGHEVKDVSARQAATEAVAGALRRGDFQGLHLPLRPAKPLAQLRAMRVG